MGNAVRGILRAKILEWVSFSRGMFLTQGSKPGLLHCRWILNPLSHQGTLQPKQEWLCYLPPALEF